DCPLLLQDRQTGSRPCAYNCTTTEKSINARFMLRQGSERLLLLTTHITFCTANYGIQRLPEF
ncbi:hypothetical protein ACXAQR_005043, partial [Escherichia coli]|nr:hypothetical protein [Escherichia coli]EGO8987644.1 hypothetical protein [Escherichia coli]MCV5397405.1 hypothetical protein [Escherichia coli]